MKKTSKQICCMLIVMSFSSALHAEESEVKRTWKMVVNFLQRDVKKEVNQTVSPPIRPCTDQNYARVLAKSPPPEPPAAPRVVKVETIAEPTKPVKKLTTREKMIENYTRLGGDPTAVAQALCFFDKNKNTNFKAQGDPSRSSGIKIDNQRYITINDMNAPLSKSRFYVLDLETGTVNTYFSSHGYGGKKGVPESDMTMEGVSNIDGSNASPRGFFVTGVRQEGSSDRKGPGGKPRWNFSMKLHGLQKGVNDNSYTRAIVMHSFPKMPSETASSDDPKSKGPIRSFGPFAVSQGCPMLSENYASSIVSKIKAPSNKSGGSLYYNYSPEEKSRGPGYCGDEGLMKK